MPSSKKSLLFLVYVLCTFRAARSGDFGDPRPCSGSHCPGVRSSRPPRQHNPTTQSRSINHHHAPSSFPSEHHATLLSQRTRSGDQTRETVQTRVAGFVGPVCADCVTPQRPDHVMNDTRECKGIECRLPLRIRPNPRPRPCAGDGCVLRTSQPPLIHVADRAAQFLGEFPDIGYPASESEAPLGVQLTCDIKPGENEVPAEDALILHLQLEKGQEKLVEALRAQQVVIRDLQQRLGEQQGALLSQQREILDQQRRMYEQMDVVKAQYGLLSETVKQFSFQGLQGELQSYFESHLAGLQSQARTHLQKSYAVHKVDVDAKVVNVVGIAGHPVLGCQIACGPEEYCDFQKDPPQCERCTMCPPGFFLVSQCSPNSDRMCQDRDECLELPSLCGERVKCLNTPGGFRCLGVSEREISGGLCGHEYFYSQELKECQACSDCDGEPVGIPCTFTSDTGCGTVTENMLSQSWTASIALPPTKSKSTSIYPGLQLNIRGKAGNNLLTNHDNYLNLQQHGLVWIDYNFALKHSCRNFLQVGIRIHGSEEEDRDLSGVRIEQPERKFFQGVTVSAAVEVEPNHTLTLVLKSPNQYCNQSKDIQAYELGGASFSLLWLSHDTGAVAMTAQMSTAAHQNNYRPTFRIATVSDPYIVALTHDSRGVRFMETGVVKFVLQQAIYSMGHSCVRDGFSLIAYVNRNGTNQEVLRSFKSGVNYRDTSINLSGATRVDSEDWLNFEIVAPSHCNVRYFGDSSGISMLSLIWIPTAVSSMFTATVSRTGLPSGAVRNKPLLFRQMSPNTDQMRLAGSGEPHAQRNFVFSEVGTVSVALNLKLIHSCSVVKLTLYRQGTDGGQATSLAQQVGGHMPEGSEWASVGLRTSFEVQNGTAIYVSLDCLRGRINQITHEGGTNISILWLAS
ncbi:uncharacterized protein nell3 [Sinocyclocheilus anshuiensis]|uniref:uncharacterized protein nell3 n=1 Tax=Sinocyclocheilus anshuiensis TaxID=1608454 RepID=UPI0007B95803|nr:PREDICTED: uncharacterized protein LOC107687554 [Sinocyclocheilus anshuiensis]